MTLVAYPRVVPTGPADRFVGELRAFQAWSPPRSPCWEPAEDHAYYVKLAGTQTPATPEATTFR